ncbi:hypothetical protein GCM10022206_88360 [Streptomyces chiangmaiensis]
MNGPADTRGPRRLGGTLNPPGTAARSSNGRGVCGPGRPKVEEPEQSGQRAPDPRSAFLCGEDGGLCVTSSRPRDEGLTVLTVSGPGGLDHVRNHGAASEGVCP